MMRERAQERLQDIVTKFPASKAADAAQELLKKLVP
jgi:outer membrane protein assembly factor BamD (BamD/ComL family)